MECHILWIDARHGLVELRLVEDWYGLGTGINIL